MTSWKPRVENLVVFDGPIVLLYNKVRALFSLHIFGPQKLIWLDILMLVDEISKIQNPLEIILSRDALQLDAVLSQHSFRIKLKPDLHCSKTTFNELRLQCSCWQAIFDNKSTIDPLGLWTLTEKGQEPLMEDRQKVDVFANWEDTGNQALKL